MIKLPNYTDKYVDEYRTQIGQSVYNKAFNDAIFWKTVFPESYDGTTLSKQFFLDVLLLPINEICAKYDSVKCYYDFAFFASLSIERIHNGERSKKNRKLNREKYINGYVRCNRYANKLLGKIVSLKNPSVSDKNFIKFQKMMRKILDRINRDVKKSINYDDIKKEHRVAILDDLSIKVCPYCNRQYIVKLNIDIGKPIGDIDHFLSQNYFALFGLSLYNFVPSCKICNSLFKSDINVDIQYPYGMYDDCNFTFEISNTKGGLTPGDLYGWSEDFSIDVKGDGKKSDINQAEREIKFFELKAQYEIHKEYVRNLLYKKNMINNSLISHMQSYLATKGNFLSDKEIKEALYGFDLDNIELLEKPLAKLTKDMYEKY